MIYALWWLLTPLLNSVEALLWFLSLRDSVKVIRLVVPLRWKRTDALWLQLHLLSFRLNIPLRQSFEVLRLDILLLFPSLRLRLQLSFKEVGELAR